MHIEQVAASIDTALRMNTTTKRIRHQQLSRYVNTYTSTLWAQRIMSALNEVLFDISRCVGNSNN